MTGKSVAFTRRDETFVYMTLYGVTTSVMIGDRISVAPTMITRNVVFTGNIYFDVLDINQRTGKITGDLIVKTQDSEFLFSYFLMNNQGEIYPQDAKNNVWLNLLFSNGFMLKAKQRLTSVKYRLIQDLGSRKIILSVGDWHNTIEDLWKLWCIYSLERNPITNVDGFTTGFSAKVEIADYEGRDTVIFYTEKVKE